MAEMYDDETMGAGPLLDNYLFYVEKSLAKQLNANPTGKIQYISDNRIAYEGKEYSTEEFVKYAFEIVKDANEKEKTGDIKQSLLLKARAFRMNMFIETPAIKKSFLEVLIHQQVSEKTLEKIAESKPEVN